jgi:hypothetical protein
MISIYTKCHSHSFSTLAMVKHKTRGTQPLSYPLKQSNINSLKIHFYTKENPKVR